MEQHLEKYIPRMQEIMNLAAKLNWIVPLTPEVEQAIPNASYPLMRLSEVEKCLLAFVDDGELKQMQRWAEDDTNLTT